MYTKITLTGYIKQSEEDIAYADTLTAEELITTLKGMEEVGKVAFEEEHMLEVTQIKVELVEVKGQ